VGATTALGFKTSSRLPLKASCSPPPPPHHAARYHCIQLQVQRSRLQMLLPACLVRRHSPAVIVLPNGMTLQECPQYTQHSYSTQERAPRLQNTNNPKDGAEHTQGQNARPAVCQQQPALFAPTADGRAYTFSQISGPAGRCSVHSSAWVHCTIACGCAMHNLSHTQPKLSYMQ
jgi:hypothetical protein